MGFIYVLKSKSILSVTICKCFYSTVLQNPCNYGSEKTEESRMRTNVSNKIHRTNVTHLLFFFLMEKNMAQKGLALLNIPNHKFH